MSAEARPLHHLIYFAAVFVAIAVYYAVRGDSGEAAAHVLMGLGFGAMTRSARTDTGPWVWGGTALVVAGAVLMLVTGG